MWVLHYIFYFVKLYYFINFLLSVLDPFSFVFFSLFWKDQNIISRCLFMSFAGYDDFFVLRFAFSCQIKETIKYLYLKTNIYIIIKKEIFTFILIYKNEDLYVLLRWRN